MACLVRSREVVAAFRKKYGGTKGVISKKRKNARLVLVTTTSALGRSSVYNRLQLGGIKYLESVGFTEGWGHFHIPDSLFDELRAYLVAKRDRYARNNRFGQGPNWRLRAIRQALDLLGIGGASIHHGLKREVFVCLLATNGYKVLRGRAKRPNFRSVLSVDEIASLALHRWMVPRAERNPSFKDWTRTQFLNAVKENGRSAGLSLEHVSGARSGD